MKTALGKDPSEDFFGFTLLEIVMTLVLIGILSSIAVPRYMDLSADAERRAAAAAVTEAHPARTHDRKP
ncbi:MAG: type II secretion system protein [Sutterella sp.]|nr:type II secretion system protein [Sutterella sp.]